MPKIIKDAKHTIINKARELLLQNNLADFNMRSIASAAGIAAGTLYNYFPSKDHLVVAVMLQDWDITLQQTEEAIAKAPTAVAGLEIIFRAIHGFANLYQFTWQSFRDAKNYLQQREQYHKALIDQISELILRLGKRFDFLFDPTVAPFLSEVLLFGASYPNANFNYLVPCLKKIVGE